MQKNTPKKAVHVERKKRTFDFSVDNVKVKFCVNKSVIRKMKHICPSGLPCPLIYYF